MNKHNKCMSYSRQFQMIQSICNSTDTTQLWKWKGSSLRNVMMDLFVSLTRKGTSWVPKTREPIPIFEVNLFRTLITSEWIHQSWVLNYIGQLVSISSNKTCLGVKSNSDSHDAALSAYPCDKKEEGQLWSFIAGNSYLL